MGLAFKWRKPLFCKKVNSHFGKGAIGSPSNIEDAFACCRCNHIDGDSFSIIGKEGGQAGHILCADKVALENIEDGLHTPNFIADCFYHCRFQFLGKGRGAAGKEFRISL